MEAYTGFSYVYDRFMQDMPYEEWAVYIKGKLEENGIYSQNSTVAELGCGTGAFTNELARMGYNMIGIIRKICWRLRHQQTGRIIIRKKAITGLYTHFRI